MSLSKEDLTAISEIVKSEVTQSVRTTVQEEMQPIIGELKALSSDVKEICSMISKLQNTNSDITDYKLTVEDKILKIHSELVAAARQAGVTLPNH